MQLYCVNSLDQEMEENQEKIENDSQIYQIYFCQEYGEKIVILSPDLLYIEQQQLITYYFRTNLIQNNTDEDTLCYLTNALMTDNPQIGFDFVQKGALSNKYKTIYESQDQTSTLYELLNKNNQENNIFLRMEYCNDTKRFQNFGKELLKSVRRLQQFPEKMDEQIQRLNELCQDHNL